MKEVTYVIAKGSEITKADLDVFEAVEGKKFIVGCIGNITLPSERFTGVTKVINLSGRKDIDEFYKDILIESPIKKNPEAKPTPKLAEEAPIELSKEVEVKEKPTPPKVSGRKPASKT